MITVVFLVMWWVTVLGYGASWSRIARYSWWVILGACGVLAIRNYITTWYPRRQLYGDAIIRVGPDESYGICGKVGCKSEVVVYDTQRDWSKIGFRSMIGWIPSQLMMSEGKHEE